MNRNSADSHDPHEDGNAFDRTPLEETPILLEQTRDDLHETPSATNFLEKTQGGPSEQLELTSTSDASSSITSFADSEEVPEVLLQQPGATSQRFELRTQVGHGATSRVYAMHDNSLDRDVAVKFLRRRRGTAEAVRNRFLHEARVTAALQHPNIMPIYDIGVNNRGELYFAMKKIEGCSLGEAIKRAQQGKLVSPEFATVDGKVRIFLKISDALAFAHSRGFVHQDIKPDNIMLGEYGEVLLVDWGSSRRACDIPTRKQLFGTPAYMSPEQAERRTADFRSDVYCLGATFFHALLLRHPVWDTDPARFWEKKRRGFIDTPAGHERRSVPTALLAVALKAMAVEPERRYQSAEAFADDLKHWQAGEPVSAYRESIPQRFRRWYRHNRRIFWTASLLSLAVLSVAGLFLREKIKEMVTWRPFFEEMFTYTQSSELSQHWIALSSRNWMDVVPAPFVQTNVWRVDSGALYGHSVEGLDNIVLRQPIPGDIRVEWEVTALRQNLNLNCFIAGADRESGYTFHVGGWGDPGRCAITRLLGGMVDEALLDEPLRVNVPYAMRMEKEGRQVRLYVDNRKVLDYHDAEDLHGPGHQSFGFEVNNGNLIRIRNVRVYHHPLPLKVSPIVTADRFYENGLFEQAHTQYAELVETYPGHDIAVEAEFKAARCLARLGSLEHAEQAFVLFNRHHPASDLAPLALHELARMAEARQDTARAEELYRDMGRRFPNHSVLRSVFFAMTSERYTHMNRERWLVFRDSSYDGHVDAWTWREARRMRELGQAFGLDISHNDFLNLAVERLCGQDGVPFDELETAFPEMRQGLAQTLLNQNACEVLLDNYADVEGAVAKALLDMGRYEELLARCPGARATRGLALLRLGRAEEALALYGDDRDVHARALEHLGRIDELIRTDCNHDSLPRRMALGTGTLAEYLSLPELDPMMRSTTWAEQGGRPDSALAIIESLPGAHTFHVNLRHTSTLWQLGRIEEARRFCFGRSNHEEQYADILRRLGRSEEAMALFPGNETVHFVALLQRADFSGYLSRFPHQVNHGILVKWLAGRYDELLHEYPRRPRLRAEILLAQERFEEVLSECPDERNACARALVSLGRHAEALDRYPERRAVAADALIAQGRLEQALQLYPEQRARVARHLLDAGSFTRVVAEFPDQTKEYAEALVLLGRFEDAPVDSGMFRVGLVEKCDLTHLAALEAFATGQHRGAHRIAARQHTYYYSADFHALRFAHFLLEPVLLALEGDTAALYRACRAHMNTYQYVMQQQLWFESAFLLGLVSHEQFLSQPLAFGVEDRFAFMNALRSDLAGDTATAAREYRHALELWKRHRDLPTPAEYEHLLSSATARRFAQWRAEVYTAP